MTAALLHPASEPPFDVLDARALERPRPVDGS